MMVPPLPKLDMKVFDLRRRDLSLLAESVMACSGTDMRAYKPSLHYVDFCEMFVGYLLPQSTAMGS